ESDLSYGEVESDRVLDESYTIKLGLEFTFTPLISLSLGAGTSFIIQKDFVGSDGFDSLLKTTVDSKLVFTTIGVDINLSEIKVFAGLKINQVYSKYKRDTKDDVISGSSKYDYYSFNAFLGLTYAL
ncbi:hypothetical protein ACFL20_08930, partial [Spirochaetota bacterium]